jgi:predicted DNA-binding transcriptional regulator YafY
VRLEDPVSQEARESFGARARWGQDRRGTVVEVEATNAEALVRHVLSFGDRAEIVSPRALRDKAAAALRALARRLA